MPGVQCNACKRVGYEAINCDMLALALFVEGYVKASQTDLARDYIKQRWLTRWKNRLGQSARTPCQVMRSYFDVLNITPDTLDQAMDWDCWPDADGDPNLK
jgi:hypothetical protein